MVQSDKLCRADQAYNMARQLSTALNRRRHVVKEKLTYLALDYVTTSNKEEAAKIKAEFDPAEFEMLNDLIERIAQSIENWTERCGTANVLNFADSWVSFCNSVSHDEALLIARTVEHYLEETSIKQTLLEGFALIAIQK